MNELKKNCKYPNIVKVLRIKECAECLYLTFCLKDKEQMERYEQSKEKWKCNYWLVMDSCRSCLFETLCRLEKQRWDDTHDVDQIS